MEVDEDTPIADKLAAALAIPNQKSRIDAYLSLLTNLLTPPLSSDDLTAFGRHFTTSTSMAMVVGRRVLGDYVAALCGGSGLEAKYLQVQGVEEGDGEISDWASRGEESFAGEAGEEVRRKVVDGVLSDGGLSGWCDEQTTVLRYLQSHLLEAEDDWYGAARALIPIPDSGSRSTPDQEKLSIYIKIVRLFLECGESGQAQTYFSRASLLNHLTDDKATLLAYSLCQARLFDFGARFNEAAQTYHKLSYDTAIDEAERVQMLKAAVTTSILAPAGPQRSRILSALNRDERVATSLPPYIATMLQKMFLEYIVRPAELKEFESGLEEHQKALVEGGGTVLERAVREHNIGACAKVYANVGFEALGALLGQDADAAETTASKMIEQGRLRAWIDQPLHLLYFESRPSHDTDADAQGTAGGLGVKKEEPPIEPVSWIERWDSRIRTTSMKVEEIAALIQKRGLLSSSKSNQSG